MKTYKIFAASAEGLEQPKQLAIEQHTCPAHCAAKQPMFMALHAIEAIENIQRVGRERKVPVLHHRPASPFTFRLTTWKYKVERQVDVEVLALAV